MIRLLLTVLASCALYAQNLVIQNVTVIDGSGAPPRTSTLVIRNGVITSTTGSTAPAASTSRKTAPRRRNAGRPVILSGPARVIDGRGLYAIPGLWDMHVHLWGDDPKLTQYVSWGVIGVRDMGSDFAHTSQLRREISTSRRTGPYIYTCGRPIDGVESKLPQMKVIAVPTPAQAQIAVDLLYDEGVDFIKVLSGLTRDEYIAVAQRSRVRRIMFAGHIPKEVKATDAIIQRQASAEHLFRLYSLPESDWSKVFADLRLFEVFQTPTLTLWKRDHEMQSGFEKAKMITAAMGRAGVPLLAGTDTGDEGVEPGEALHDELQLLVESGLTPLQALQTATTSAALWFGEDKQRGLLKSGYRADLVLLTANPLDDIRNTRRIRMVIQRGRVVAGAKTVGSR